MHSPVFALVPTPVFTSARTSARTPAPAPVLRSANPFALLTAIEALLTLLMVRWFYRAVRKLRTGRSGELLATAAGAAQP